MYRLSYAEIADDDTHERRSREVIAFDHGIELLTRAAAGDPRSAEATEAVRYVQQLWGFLISDLADPGNSLAAPLRTDLISIGLWVIREADRLLSGASESFKGLIDINRTVRDGLR
jgi:flagellar protein FlaF